MLGRHRGLLCRREMRTHRYAEEQGGRHHPHQRGSLGTNRLQFRKERSGIQGADAQLDADTNERVDSFCRNYQEYHISREKT